MFDSWYKHYKIKNDMKVITKRKYIRPEVTVIGLSDECPLLAGSDPATINPPKKQEHETCNIDDYGDDWPKICECDGDECWYKKGQEP